MEESRFYDWSTTLTYDADITMVLSERGYGKTFGLRRQCINDCIKKGWTSFELVRCKPELKMIMRDYHEKVSELEEFSDYMFQTKGRTAFIAKKPNDDQDDFKPDWKPVCYFGAMTEVQAIKKASSSYIKVRRIIFDEAIIDRKIDRYSQYLPNEPIILASIIDSVSRERPDSKLHPRAYLLANAVDAINPWFAYYRIPANIDYGYRWFGGKTFLLHYSNAPEYATEKAKQTVAGRMLSLRSDGRKSLSNEFDLGNEELISVKTPTSQFSFGVAYGGRMYGVWVDFKKGVYFVNRKTPSDARTVFAITNSDYQINYVGADRAKHALKRFGEFHYLGCVRYSDHNVMSEFVSMLGKIGLVI